MNDNQLTELWWKPISEAGTGVNSIDCGKKGTERSILTDGKGIPHSVIVNELNHHDKKLLKRILDVIIFGKPSPDEGTQNIYMDRGFICEKSGYFTKQVQNFTIKKVNHSHHSEEWYIKVLIIASKCEKRIFAT